MSADLNAKPAAKVTHVKHDDSGELESEEMVNDSLGEVTPSDSTGLDSKEEVRKREHPA